MKAASIRRPAEDAPCQGHETSWLDGALKPAHQGLYQRKMKIVGREWFWSVWDGSRWMGLSSTAQGALTHAKAKRVSKYQFLCWRGCSQPPSGRRREQGAKREIKKGDYFFLPFAGELPELLVRAVAFNATTGHWAIRYACSGRKSHQVLLQSCKPCTPQRAQRIIDAWKKERRE